MRLFKAKHTEPAIRQRRPENSESIKVTSSYSYSSRRSEDAINTGRTAEQAKLSQNKFKKSRRRIVYIVLSLLVLAAVIKTLSLSTYTRILPRSTNSAVPLTNEQKIAYQQSASQYLSGSLFNKNKITVDTLGLSHNLLNMFPEISSVNVTVPLVSNSLTVYIEPAQPAIVLNEASGSFAVDDTGRIMYKVSQSQHDSLDDIPNVTDQSALKVQVNKQVLSSTNVSFIKEVVGQLAAKNIRIASLTLPSGYDELDVSPVGEPYFIKFNLENNDPRQQAGTYLATIAQLETQGITPAKYIDVRVDGRAYYQ